MYGYAEVLALKPGHHLPGDRCPTLRRPPWRPSVRARAGHLRARCQGRWRARRPPMDAAPSRRWPTCSPTDDIVLIVDPRGIYRSTVATRRGLDPPGSGDDLTGLSNDVESARPWCLVPAAARSACGAGRDPPGAWSRPSSPTSLCWTSRRRSATISGRGPRTCDCISRVDPPGAWGEVPGHADISCRRRCSRDGRRARPAAVADEHFRYAYEAAPSTVSWTPDIVCWRRVRPRIVVGVGEELAGRSRSAP